MVNSITNRSKRRSAGILIIRITITVIVSVLTSPPDRSPFPEPIEPTIATVSKPPAINIVISNKIHLIRFIMIS